MKLWCILVIRILQFGLRIHRLLERSIWSWFNTLLRWNLDFPLRAPLSRWWRRVLRTIYHEMNPSQHPEDILYEYCALSTRDFLILEWFCGFIWLRGGVFWTLLNLHHVTFVVELWWSEKAHWTSLDSSRILLDHFCDFRNLPKIYHFWGSFSAHSVTGRAPVETYGARINIL